MSTPVDVAAWLDANQRYLAAGVRRIRALLERHVAQRDGGDEPAASPGTAWGQSAAAEPALEQLCRRFGLSGFERDALLLCAAMDLDAAVPQLCALAQGDAHRPYPTFALALGALEQPHWSALAPNAPLRHWRLVELADAQALTLGRLRIDERILHYLSGVDCLDARLAGAVTPAPRDALTPSQRALAARLARLWSGAVQADSPVLELIGPDIPSKRAIAAEAAAILGCQLQVMPARALPTSPADGEALLRTWEREAILSGSALLLDCEELEQADLVRGGMVGRFAASPQPLLIASRERLAIPDRPVVALDVPRPSREEQRAIWQTALGDVAARLNGQVDAIVQQFDLNLPGIHTASAALGDEVAAGAAGAVLWDACREQLRPRMEELAQRLEPAATWEELVLPEAQRQVLRVMCAHVRQRGRVYETWGFAGRGARGLGISALFAGPSGAGKTMAAEVLAGELRLDLYRIDLSSVVSKYIGETEKNLRRLFDAAEEGGSILLFDEADALFGKRSEVKDSHDRYANIEVGYLLQRVEDYRGLAILTTNMKDALDRAFLRRIRFVAQFPFPDAAHRAEIWRRIFPAATPTDGLDYVKLARLGITGGNIRAIAVNAAFLAAEADEPVRMVHLLAAARMEYAKLEKPLTAAEIEGWDAT